MVRVTASIWIWRSEDGPAGWHFLTIPEEQAGEFRAQSLARRSGFGSVRVAATVNGVTWRTSVFPQKSGGYLLPIKASVRRDAGIVAGDEVSAELDVL